MARRQDASSALTPLEAWRKVQTAQTEDPSAPGCSPDHAGRTDKCKPIMDLQVAHPHVGDAERALPHPSVVLKPPDVESLVGAGIHSVRVRLVRRARVEHDARQ